MSDKEIKLLANFLEHLDEQYGIFVHINNTDEGANKATLIGEYLLARQGLPSFTAEQIRAMEKTFEAKPE